MKNDNLLIYGISALAIGGGLYLFLKKPKVGGGGGGDVIEPNRKQTPSTNAWDFNNFLKTNILPANSKFYTATKAVSVATQIYATLDKVTAGDTKMCIALIKSIPSKYSFSQVCQAFFNKYNKTMDEYISQGKYLHQSGLSDAEATQVNDNVNRKATF
jgi:hypothetical protein